MSSLSSSLAGPVASADFARFDEKAAAGGRLTVAFLGGSLTWGARSTDPQQTSWRALMGKRLEAHYPDAHFTFRDAAIGGTGSQLAVFRLQRDVLAHKPDLVFIEFTVNDDPAAPQNGERLAAYESLVRRVLQAGIPVELVVLPVKRDTVSPVPTTRPLDGWHKEIAAAYGTPLADAVAWTRAKVQSGAVSADAIWCYPPDVTHPGDKGYALYAEAAWDAYLQAVRDKTVCRLPGAMLHAPTYTAWNRQRLSALPLPAGWAPGLPKAEGAAFDFYMSRWLDDVVIASPGAASWKATFDGSFAMLFGEATPKSGKFRVLIDGAPAPGPDGKDGVFDAHSKDGTLRFVPVVAQGLPAGPHTLELVPDLQPGEELRLESLCVAGGRATVTPLP